MFLVCPIMHYDLWEKKLDYRLGDGSQQPLHGHSDTTSFYCAPGGPLPTARLVIYSNAQPRLGNVCPLKDRLNLSGGAHL